MIIDELISVLGYKIQGEADLKRYQASLNNVQQQAERVGRTVGIAVAAMATAVTGSLIGLGKSVIQTGETFEELGGQLKALEGSSEKAAAAMEWIEDFAVRTPLELQEVVKGYTQLRTYGLDPTKGSLLALVDTMAMSGKGQEHLSGLITAVGQAWTKQKLQGEEAMQLLERGVPVWDLLSTALGKSAAEVQDLASKGKLGRKEITLLIDAMGKRSAGASDEFAKLTKGVRGNINDMLTEFRKRIGRAGFFDAYKRQLESFLGLLRQWAADGTMDKVAKTLGGAMTTGLRWASDATHRFALNVRDLMKYWKELQPYILGAGLGFGALIARSHPFIAALTALGLALDDFFAYRRGDRSVIGELMKEFSDGTIFKNANKSFQEFVVSWSQYIKDAITDGLWGPDYENIGKDIGTRLWDGFKSVFSLLFGQELENAKRYLGLDTSGTSAPNESTYGNLQRKLYGTGATPTTPGTGTTPRRAWTDPPAAAPAGRRPMGRVRRMRTGGTVPARGPGHAAAWSEREAYIRQAAAARGLNPDDMVALAKTEGAGRYVGDHGKSFGDFQLYTGGGEGNRFSAATGLDPSDPKTWKAQTDFALNRIIQTGNTNAWYGPRDQGIRGRLNANIAAARRAGSLRTLPVGRQASVHPWVADNNRIIDRVSATAGHTSNATTHVGDIHVNVKNASEAPDAVGQAISDAVEKGPNMAPSRMQASPAL